MASISLMKIAEKMDDILVIPAMEVMSTGKDVRAW